MVNRELSDADIVLQAEAFLSWFGRRYVNWEEKPEAFEFWAETKDFAPGDFDAIRATVFLPKKAESVA